MFDPVVPGPRTSRAWDAALLAQAVTVGPGPVAIGLLEQVDPDELCGHDRVVFLTAWQAQAAWVTARSFAAILPVVGPQPARDPDPDDEGGPVDLGPFECVEEARHAEVAAACRLSTVAASDRITTARFLAGPGAPVAGMLETGAWGYGHLSAVVSETAELSAALTERVVQTVVAETLPDADGVASRYAEETPGRLRHRIRRTILRLDAAAAAERAKKRRRERSLRISPLPDFRARITLEASQPMASWAWRQFDTWARARQATLKDPAADLTVLLGPCTCPIETGTGTSRAESVGTLAALRGHHRRQPEGSGTGAVADPNSERTHQLGCPHHPDTTLEALRADAVIEAARLLIRHLGLDTSDAPTTTGATIPASGAATTDTGLPGTGTSGNTGANESDGAGTGADAGAGAGAAAGSAPAGASAGAGTGAGRGRSWSSAVVIVDAPTLLGLADNPGWVPGHGWVPAPLARELAAGADTWRAFLTDHGRLVATRYRPSDRLRELVTARDTTCTFPGCTIPSVHTDLDHAANYDGGNTTAANLHPACRRHHRIKTHTTWSAAPDPGSGQIRWTSPTGHTYPTPPDPIWDTGPPPGDVSPDLPAITPESADPQTLDAVDPARTDPPVSALEIWLTAHLAA
ncbi:MAG: HNH endonuclease signature motif containing protein [Candidatus Nanopelagicales bacterium]